MKSFRPEAAYAALATLSLAVFSFSSQSVAGACDATVTFAKSGCDLQALSDYDYQVGTCANFVLLSAKARCLSGAAQTRAAARRLCIAQADARDDVCDAVGQAPYDPVIVPADFSTTINNPLFPLKPGNVWVYRNGDAQVTVTVTPRTIKIAGVTCVVVHDVNRVDGKIEEDTFDYYAQHKDGTVWYFGEDTIAYDHGIANTQGSWRAGLDSAKPGIIMSAHPQLGKTYRQEFRLGVAEDMARNIAANQHVTVPFGTFNNALKIHEFTPLEPGKSENKFYVPGIGNVLAIDLVTGEREALVSFTPGP